MRSTITARGQTVIPAPIRARFALGPSQRLIADRPPALD
jgi:bifunctional DNA-binding transcriptional regulator/antitoxin component of YhaV-PrlF toxin-antitoxin module